ncbi:PAS domain-containing sensor histidine kinase [Halarchaeum sp. P4]|uniref:PAS domain-containing sensor histidine kinase n=1 Tax=Halarchaeum sp. P4 TaxID=3421639 RepID=UPI003EBAB35B
MDQSGALGVLLDYSQDKISLLDADGVFQYVSGAVDHMLGYDPDELCGENAFDYIHPDDVTEVRDAFMETIENESFAEATVTYRHRTKDGEWVWLESRLSNVTDAELDGYVVSSRDITDRVEAEAASKESELRLEQLAAGSADVLWMFSADWRELLFINPSYEDIYGGSVDALREDPSRFLDMIHPDDVPVVKEGMTDLSQGIAVDMEYRVNPELDYGRWVWVKGHPIMEDGDVVRITGFTRDVTDRQRRERQLVVIDNLLRHNLRNDLNLILGTADLIEGDVPSTTDRVTVIRQTGEHLLKSAEKGRDLIDLITDQAGLHRLDLRTLVEQSVTRVRERYPDATIEVSGDDSALVEGRLELRVAICELLENPIQHADADATHIDLSLHCSASRVELVVEDDAPPIPAVEADVLHGVHEMSSVYHSSGLGFWLVYWSVELSNGTISIESDDDGNRITLSFPRVEL